MFQIIFVNICDFLLALLYLISGTYYRDNIKISKFYVFISILDCYLNCNCNLRVNKSLNNKIVLSLIYLLESSQVMNGQFTNDLCFRSIYFTLTGHMALKIRKMVPLNILSRQSIPQSKTKLKVNVSKASTLLKFILSAYFSVMT